MKSIDGVSLKDFISSLAALKGLPQSKQAIAILLWHERNEFEKEMTAKQLADVMHSHGLAKPRPDKLSAQIRGLRATLPGATKGSLRVQIGEAANVAGWA